ncbi:queuosine precursor transporter [Enterobacter asburiae]
MSENEKYKLLGFDHAKRNVNLMVLNTGRVLSVSYDQIRNSEIIDDLNKREIESVYRKIYSSGYSVDTEYDFIERPEKQWFFYSICCMIISVCYIFSNISAVKPVYLERFNLIITPGTFIYPFTFLVVDLLNEFFGYKRARTAIILCVIANSVILGLLTVSLSLPTIDGWRFNSGYHDLIIQIQSTFIASTLSFTVSEIVNSKVLCFIKKLTNSNYLYIRIVSSIFIASVFDSFIFCFIAFYGLMDTVQIVDMVMIQIFIKIFYALFNVFPAYGARYLFRKYLAYK